MPIGENKQPDLEWDGEEKAFVRAVERLLRKHKVEKITVEGGKVTHVYYAK